MRRLKAIIDHVIGAVLKDFLVGRTVATDARLALLTETRWQRWPGFMISNFHSAEDASSPGEFARSLEHE